MNTEAEIKGHQETCNSFRPKWGEGPWENEPDRMEFKHAGFDCLLSRNPTMGGWCGYVGLPKGHPLHGKGYHEIENDFELQVHGGITYSEECGRNICHVTESPDNLWWLGFDCAHGYDVLPCSSEELKRIGGATYKDVTWVRDETSRLAEQLAELK